jgi:tRNA(Ile)-lysidine synthase
MPRFRAGSPAVLRPLLRLRRAELEAYAGSHEVAWVEDESNRDRHHRRNLIRHDIAPRLATAFPGYPKTLQRAAEHQADTGELLDALAAQDGTGALDDVGLARTRLAALPDARARNLLRWFLRSQGLRAPSQARLTEMLRQIIAARGDARASIQHEGVEVGIHRGRVLVHAPPPAAFTRLWHGEPEVEVPGGALRFRAAVGDGFSAATTAKGPLVLRSRSGGERLQLATDRPRRALKKLLQDARIPHWQREAGWTLEWRPDALRGPRTFIDRSH